MQVLAGVPLPGPPRIPREEPTPISNWGWEGREETSGTALLLWTMVSYPVLVWATLSKEELSCGAYKIYNIIYLKHLLLFF